jgi:predicted amidohydrolase YtcJ
MHTTGHYGVANHQALRIAHITAESKDPPAGTIDRDAQGAPTGVLKESAMDAVRNLIPPPTPEQWRNGVLRMVDTLHREGMTAVKDPDIEQPVWDAYAQLLQENKLQLHVCVLWHGGTTLKSARATIARIQSLPRPPNSLGDGNLLSCGAKLWASVEREPLKGVYGKHPFGTPEATDVIRSYTVWAARQLFLEGRVGSIEPGKEADIAVWDRDMYTIASAELRSLKCEMTIYHGQIVYRTR